MKRLLTGFCTLLLLAGFVHAREISEAMVRDAVQHWVRTTTSDARPGAVVERLEARVENGRAVAYVVHLAGGGYCLAGADDLVLPVYFYSPRGTYDPSDPGPQIILEEIAARTLEWTERVASGESDLIQKLSDRSRLWEDMALGTTEAPKVAPQRMDLPLSSTWDQVSPYNDYCPVLPVPGNPMNTLVGCVATTMSQLMYYWKWPSVGSGSHSTNFEYRWRNGWDEEPLSTDPGISPSWSARLEWTSANGGRLRMNGTWDRSVYNAARGFSSDSAYLTALEALWNRMTVVNTSYSANFGATNYNWNIMSDAPSDPPTAGSLEVAKLSHHAGIAFDMEYGIWFSGSDLWRAETPMENYFRYDTDANYKPMDIDEMAEEIEWHRPFAVSGSDGSTGHAWVIFGYDKSTDPNRLFHMNMGWGGSQDGWYIKDSVPQNLTNCCQRQLTHIAPVGAVRFVGGSSGGDGSPADPYASVAVAVASAPNDARLIFRAGTTHTLTSALVIDRAFTLEGTNVIIR